MPVRAAKLIGTAHCTVRIENPRWAPQRPPAVRGCPHGSELDSYSARRGSTSVAVSACVGEAAAAAAAAVAGIIATGSWDIWVCARCGVLTCHNFPTATLGHSVESASKRPSAWCVRSLPRGARALGETTVSAAGRTRGTRWPSQPPLSAPSARHLQRLPRASFRELTRLRFLSQCPLCRKGRHTASRTSYSR